MVYIDAEGATCTRSCLTTGDFCSASGLMIPTEMVAVPAPRLTVLCTSPEEMKVVATSAPATCNCVPATKPEPSTSSRKVLPGVVCVTEPAAKTGRGLSILTLREAAGPGFGAKLALTVTE